MTFFEDNTEQEVNNSLWVEKYRPRKLTEYVGNEHLKQKVSDYLQTGDVPRRLVPFLSNSDLLRAFCDSAHNEATSSVSTPSAATIVSCIRLCGRAEGGTPVSRVFQTIRTCRKPQRDARGCGRRIVQICAVSSMCLQCHVEIFQCVVVIHSVLQSRVWSRVNVQF